MNLENFGYVSLEWLLWMSATTIAFWATPYNFRSWVLVALTLSFLLLNDARSCALLVFLTLFTFGMTRKGTVSGRRATAAVSSILLILLFYKATAYRTYMGGLLIETVLPLGISYYSLRCIHYVIECYKGRINFDGAGDLVKYLFFLPTIWIGPIHRYDDYIKDQRRHRWDPELFSKGLERILYGYAKVVIIGNVILTEAYNIWAPYISGSDSRLEVYLEIVRIGLHLYMLFSGYSDIAIGFGFLLGFKVLENFNWPYLQKNISDFWRCWHISLTGWCREYIYTVVVAKTRSPAAGIFSTLIVIGLWHEFSFRYLAWGLYHGLGIFCWGQFKKIRQNLPEIHSKFFRCILDIASTLLTLHFVWLGFILVRQPDFQSMLAVLKSLILGA